MISLVLGAERKKTGIGRGMGLHWGNFHSNESMNCSNPGMSTSLYILIHTDLELVKTLVRPLTMPIVTKQLQRPMPDIKWLEYCVPSTV